MARCEHEGIGMKTWQSSWQCMSVANHRLGELANLLDPRTDTQEVALDSVLKCVVKEFDRDPRRSDVDRRPPVGDLPGSPPVSAGCFQLSQVVGISSAFTSFKKRQTRKTEEDPHPKGVLW